MKRFAAIMLVCVLLSGCSRGQDRINRCMELRSRVLRSGCSFTAEITADYGDKIYTFTVDCAADSAGELTFAVVQPESIAGITGSISGEGGFLTFEDAVLHFELLADETLSPVSAPWIFIKTLRGGYLTSAGDDGDLLRVTIDDSYEEDALQLDIWLDGEDIPVQVDILYDGRRILSMTIRDFAFV